MPDASAKPYKGRGMDGVIATPYARQAEHDRDELQATARRIAAPLNAGSRVLEIAPGQPVSQSPQCVGRRSKLRAGLLCDPVSLKRSSVVLF